MVCVKTVMVEYGEPKYAIQYILSRLSQYQLTSETVFFIIRTKAFH